ncbi:MAG: SIS domain-containing protein [Bacillales bacterium]|nr:SIS domain-containing protein [Bacillales bacterium]
MKNRIIDLIERYPILKPCSDAIENTYRLLEECYKKGNKMLLAGNGGSFADADHIVGELMKGFEKRRPISKELKNQLLQIDPLIGEGLSSSLQMGLPAINLGNHQSLNSAFLNDVKNGDLYIFAQQVLGYGKEGDVLFAISTSGNSKNIINAVVVAKALGMKTIALTGKDGGNLAPLCDVAIIVPLFETYKIQECHLPIYHTLCLMLEDTFF